MQVRMHVRKALSILRLGAMVIGGMMMTTPAQAQGLPFEESQLGDPLALYGAEIAFDVYRKGDLVGAHTVTFTPTETGVEVVSRFEIAIKVLFITAYRYTYESTGHWQEGVFRAMTAEVNDNGDKIALDVQTAGDGYKITGRDGTYTAEAPLYPTTHWHAGIVSQTQVLNTLTGNLDSVVITPQGSEVVATAAGEVDAYKFIYSGDLDVTVWYDAEGRWVKMLFPGKDGTLIEYVCRSC